MGIDASVQNLSSGWKARLKALGNIPPVLGIVWDSGPAVVVSGCILRVLSALIPVAMLYVTRLIIDAVVTHVAKHGTLRPDFWWLVALEFGFPIRGDIQIGLVQLIIHSGRSVRRISLALTSIVSSG